MKCQVTVSVLSGQQICSIQMLHVLRNFMETEKPGAPYLDSWRNSSKVSMPLLTFNVCQVM